MEQTLINFMHIMWIIRVLVLVCTNFRRFHNFCSIFRKLMLAKFYTQKLVSLRYYIITYILFLFLLIILLQVLYVNRFCSSKILFALLKKWSFPLKISSVNVTKSAGLRIRSHILKKSLMENFIFEQCYSLVINIFMQST